VTILLVTKSDHRIQRGGLKLKKGLVCGFSFGLVIFSMIEFKKWGAYSEIQQAAGLSNFNDDCCTGYIDPKSSTSKN